MFIRDVNRSIYSNYSELLPVRRLGYRCIRNSCPSNRKAILDSSIVFDAPSDGEDHAGCCEDCFNYKYLSPTTDMILDIEPIPLPRFLTLVKEERLADFLWDSGAVPRILWCMRRILDKML